MGSKSITDDPTAVVVSGMGRNLTVVRNSIILVDLINLKLAEGKVLEEAVVEAGMETPGFAVPGALGIASLALFFWGHWLVHLAGWDDIRVYCEDS